MIILLIIVVVIVAIVVLIMRSSKKRALKFAEIKSRAASGDSDAAKELIAMATRQELEALAAEGNSEAEKKIIEQGSSSSCNISCAGSMPDNIVALQESATKKIIAENGGPGEYDWEQTGNKTNKGKYNESWTLEYKSPQGDRIELVYVYYQGGGYEEEGTGRKGYGVNSWISVRLNLKMLPEKVQSIGKQVEQVLREYLSSKGETIIKSRF